jgi:hypothetical protein
VRRHCWRNLRALGVPAACTRAEFPLSSIDPRVRDRADVVVFAPTRAAMVPVLLAECKAPDVPLTEDVFAPGARAPAVASSDVGRRGPTGSRCARGNLRDGA